MNFPLQTAVGALQLSLGMERPGQGSFEEKVLIWGAGGAVGSYAVQYAHSVSTFIGFIIRITQLIIARLGIL